MIDLQFYFSIVRQRLFWFAIPCVLVGVAGAAWVMSMPRIYNSSAKLLVESQQISDSFVKSTVTSLATERLQVIQQRVNSRENLLRLADKFKLFADSPGLSRSDIADKVRERLTISLLDINLSGSKKNAATRRNEDRLTVAFSIGFDDENPATAAKVANELVTIVLEEDARSRADRASETTRFLSRESERLANDLTVADAAIAKYKLEYSEALPEKLSFNMTQLERYQAAIAESERSVSSLENQKRLLELEVNVRQVAIGQGGGTGKAGASANETRLAEFQNAFRQKSAVFAANHPEMRALRKVIEDLEKQIAEERAAAAKLAPVALNDPSQNPDIRLAAEKIVAVDQSITLARKQKDELTKAIEVLKKIVETTPEVGANLQSMERKRAALQASADDIAIKLSQARLGERMEEDQQAERFEVLEAPIVPNEPVRPKRPQLLLLAAAAALGIGSVFAGGAEMLDGKVRRSSDITRKLGLPVLVAVPYMKTRTVSARRRGIHLLLAATLLALLILFVMALMWSRLPGLMEQFL